MSDQAVRAFAAVLQRRAENGGKHLHHRDCIHNLTPERQVEMRGKTVEWWTKLIGPLPVQITADDWETEPIDFGAGPATPTEPTKDAPPSFCGHTVEEGCTGHGDF